MAARFDLDAFARAAEAQDHEAWLAWYAPDAQWWEYRHADPPRSPHVLAGRQQIGEHLLGVCCAPVTIDIELEVPGQRRSAFMLTVTLADGRRIIENVIVDHPDGLITRQVDVEAWD
jgi:hypothetical protein